MRKIQFLFLAVTFTFFTGCIPGKVISFEALKPAEYTFPEDVKHVLVFNFAYPPSVDTSSFNELPQLNPSEQFFVDTIVIKNVFNGLYSVLDNSPAAYLNNAPYYELRPQDTVAFLEPLAQSSIDHLCDTFNVDAIISFEYYGLSVDTKTYNTVAYDDGYYTVTAADQAMMRVMLWRIYDRKLGLINEKRMQDTLYWSAYGIDDSDARSNLPDVGDLLREAFWYGGNKYGSEISPSWEDTKRSYFELTNRKGNTISLVEPELKEIALGDRKIKAYKAAYNLSLYYEMHDSIDAAVNWIDKALEYRPEAGVAKYYQSILQKREKSVMELKKQLDH